MFHELKKGDIVIAKKNNGYGVTTDGWKGKVTRDYKKTMFFEAESIDEDETFDDLDIDRFYIIYTD